jgi:hypothetical protein
MSHRNRVLILLGGTAALCLLGLFPEWKSIEDDRRRIELSSSITKRDFSHVSSEDRILSLLSPSSALWRVEKRENKVCAIHPLPLPSGIISSLLSSPHFIYSIVMDDLSLIVTFTP